MTRQNHSKKLRTTALLLAVLMLCLFAFETAVSYERSAETPASSAADHFSRFPDLCIAPSAVNSGSLERSSQEFQPSRFFNLRRASSSYLRELASPFKMPVLQKITPDGRAHDYLIPIYLSALTLAEKVVSYVHDQNGPKGDLLFFSLYL